MDFQMQPGNGNELGIRSSKDAPATRRYARVSFIAPDSCEGLIASYRLSLRPPPGVAVTALKHDGVGFAWSGNDPNKTKWRSAVNCPVFPRDRQT